MPIQQQFHVAPAMQQPNSAVSTPLRWLLKKRKKKKKKKKKKEKKKKNSTLYIKGYSYSFRIACDMSTASLKKKKKKKNNNNNKKKKKKKKNNNNNNNNNNNKNFSCNLLRALLGRINGRVLRRFT